EPDDVRWRRQHRLTVGHQLPSGFGVQVFDEHLAVRLQYNFNTLVPMQQDDIVAVFPRQFALSQVHESWEGNGIIKSVPTPEARVLWLTVCQDIVQRPLAENH